MNASSVLDSYALLALVFHERVSAKITDLVVRAEDTERALLIASPNWAEVRYRVQRILGIRGWEVTRGTLLALPIQIIPADQDLAEAAGELKVSRRMSLADCFAAALAKQRGLPLYTGDREFRAVESEIRIVWL